MDATYGAQEPRRLAMPGSPGSGGGRERAAKTEEPADVLGVRTIEPQEPLQRPCEENLACCEFESTRIPSLNRSLSMDEMELSLVDSPFFYVPSEVTLEILRNLPVDDLKSAFLVCRLWAVERANEMLWKTVAFQRYADLYQLKPSRMSWRALALAAANSLPDALDPAPERALARVKFVRQHPPQLLQGEFVGYLRKGQPCGFGIFRHEGGNCYFGEFADGKKHGFGEFRWKNGNTYIGEWEADKQTGQGEFKWNDGDHYKVRSLSQHVFRWLNHASQGQWKDDHRHGKGTYTWPKGSYYEGEFQMNDLHNYGRYTWKSGYYEGGWKNSTRHGKGTIRWTNGNKFEGDFVNNAKSGYGVYRWSDGATYSGTWDADDRSGQAVTAWANGMSYTGKYLRDLRNGEGVLRWPNGDTYEGVWRNGGRYGVGVFTEAATGARTQQTWREEEKIQYSKGIPARFPQQQGAQGK